MLDEKDFERIYEECVCAGGSSGASAMAPEHMLGVVDTKVGNVSRGRNLFTKGAGTDYAFINDTMTVHKKRNGKKGDAITGTGIVYANGRVQESNDYYDEDQYEREHECEITECCNCGADCSEDGEFIRGDLYCRSCAEREHRSEEYEDEEVNEKRLLS